MLGLCICLTFIALAALFGITALTIRTLALVEKTHEQACLVARSQQEAATKYLTENVQTAMLISDKTDARVRERIKIMNTKPGSSSRLEAIEDAPAMPDVFQSGFVNDSSEIEREIHRPRKMEFEYDARDRDFAAEEI